ncbi:FGFR1 oncogene partner 2 isoform X1 [Coturnix japonica]|uniref:FGFR1 oncogene partner 2 isoform X1 n=2 Tax=Coturnix japonica TaxID=93934 RepID=UPI000776BC08|nr:FGFR1 oncogene partner 2 isoform X1 [Coturnix japonica]
MKMSCTIEKALADAKALVERLREHDNAAEALIEQTTALNKRVEAMKQYQEEIQELNEVARHRPRSTLVMGIQQENRQIRELQQENKELRTSLEEHQSALELIMSKYREQMFRLLMASKKDDPSIIMKLKEQHSKELQVHVDQITEMAAVMRKAIEIDDKHGCKEQERIIQLESFSTLGFRNSQLPVHLLPVLKASIKIAACYLHGAGLFQQENKGLREILQITRESFLNLKKEDASESTSLSGLVTSSDLSLRKS